MSPVPREPPVRIPGKVSGVYQTQKPKAKPEPAAPVDWTDALRLYGIPKDVVARLDQIFRGSGSIEQALPVATAYVRGTDWYAKTFPGIQQGINTGLFNDEQGYREYQNQVSQMFKQYYKRPATSGEVAGFAKGGESVSRVAAGLQAKAIEGNLSDPLRALFSPAELQAFANQQAGIDSELGQRITQQADLAVRVDGLYKDFFGRSVTRDELQGLTSQGLSPEQVAKNFATDANIRAMDPAVSALFTPEEIRELALERAGGVTPGGQVIAAQAKLAATLNPIFHQYTGAGVSREDVVRAYQSGESLDAIRSRFAGQAFVDANRGDVQQALGSFGGGMASEQDLQAFGQQAAGYDNPAGLKIQAAFEKARRRMDRVAQGVLANPALGLLNGRPAGQQRRPDTAA